MKKRATSKYNPRIGQLIVDFLEYFGKHEEESMDVWDLDEALQYFGTSQNLKSTETYRIAMQLYSQGYPIDPVEFHPDYISEGERKEIPSVDSLNSDIKQRTIFDEYKDALMRQDYEKAHIIFESMTPSQKQVIRDRRAKMNEKLNKKAQETAALEKNIPVAGPKAEDVPLMRESPLKETEELSELVGPADDLIDNHHSLNLPPQSMTVFLPFGHALDEFKRVREEKRMGKAKQEDVRRRTQDFLANYGKVLHYLDTQGFDVVELQNLLKKYANLFFMQPTANLNQKILALATDLQKKGMPDLAKRLITAAGEESWREFEDAWTNLETPQKPAVSENPVEEANKIVDEHMKSSPALQFLKLLEEEKFDEAREAYLHLSPEERTQADKLARQHFAATNILSLQKVGQSLVSKGKYTEANEITQIIKAQFAELPMEDQKEVILLILPAGEKLDFLPQAFNKSKGGEEPQPQGQGKMCDKMEEMKCRLNPLVSARTIGRILKLADRLDEKGQTELADKITSWIEVEVKKAQTQPQLQPAAQPVAQQAPPSVQLRRDVGVFPCPQCRQDIYFDKSKGGRPPFCSNCGKGTLGVGKVIGEKLPGGLAKGKKDDEFDEKQLEKGIKVELEHSGDKEAAKEIAKDHLTENPKYYDHLEDMEKKMDKEAPKAK